MVDKMLSFKLVQAVFFIFILSVSATFTINTKTNIKIEIDLIAGRKALR